MPYEYNPFTDELDKSGGSLAIGDAITSGTEGSVLYLGVGGIVSQDNPALTYLASVLTVPALTSAGDISIKALKKIIFDAP